MSGFQSDAFDAGGFDAGTATTYTLIASAGAFAVSGIDAALRAAYAMPATAGSLSLSGAGAGMTAARLLTASAGSLALSGQAATLTFTAAPPAGTYALPAGAGTFVLSGQAATFKRALRMDAAPGSFSTAYLPTTPPASEAVPEVQQAASYAMPKKRARYDQPSLRMASDEPIPQPKIAPVAAPVFDLSAELARIAALEGVTADALLQGISAQKQFHSTIQAMEQERAVAALLRQQAASEHAHAAAMDEQDIEFLLTAF